MSAAKLRFVMCGKVHLSLVIAIGLIQTNIQVLYTVLSQSCSLVKFSWFPVSWFLFPDCCNTMLFPEFSFLISVSEAWIQFPDLSLLIFLHNRKSGNPDFLSQRACGSVLQHMLSCLTTHSLPPTACSSHCPHTSTYWGILLRPLSTSVGRVTRGCQGQCQPSPSDPSPRAKSATRDPLPATPGDPGSQGRPGHLSNTRSCLDVSQSHDLEFKIFFGYQYKWICS